MPKYVEAFGQVLEFPDGMSEADMAAAIKKNSMALSPAYQNGRALNSSPTGAAIQGLSSVAQGPTFGFADELAGLGGGALSVMTGGEFGKGYRQYRDFMRGAADKQQQDNPITTALTRGAASMPLAAGAPQAVAATAKAAMPGTAAAFQASPNGAALVANLQRNHPTLSALSAASGFGVTSGALEGIGSSSGGTAGEIGTDAGKSALIGAAAPFAVLPLARGVSAVAGNVASRFSDSQALRMAKEKVAEAFSRDTRGSAVTSPIPQASARLDKLGPDASIADSGGASVRGLLDTLATLPGETKDAVERMIRSRQAGRAGRMIGAADDALGAGGQRLAPTLQKLIADRKSAAAPLYADVYKQGVFINDDLRQIIDAAHKLGAGGEAKRIATAEMRTYGIQPETQWSGMRELDYLKQGLDDIILANKRDDGSFTKVGAAVHGLKDQLVGVLDTATKGAYAKARAAYAGPSSVIDAANEGRKAMTRDDAAINSITSGMGAAELEGFRIGAFEALRAKLGKEAGQTEILKMWKEPATREKLQAIFPTERSYREFASRVAAEGRLKALESTGRGSQTAARQYGAGDLDAPAIRQFGAAAVDAKTGNIPGLFDKAASAWNRVATPEPVRDAMGKILLTRGEDAKGGLLSVQQIAEEVANNRRRQAGALGLLSGLF